MNLIINFNAMIMSFKEVAHVLGLEDNPFINIWNNTGWNISDAIASIKNRYQALKPEPNSKLAFKLLSSQSPKGFSKNIKNLSEGEYLGLSTHWVSFNALKGVSSHAYTLHTIKEKNKTHFIYVNRGQRHYTSNKKTYRNTVTVFSIDNHEAPHFAEEMIKAADAEGDGRTNMSLFLQKQEKKINPHLSKLLSKKDQKTGNCTVANSNIAWHFQLASDYMKKHQTSFEGAYDKTKELYKDMRLRDRVAAFNQLLNTSGSYGAYRSYFYNYIQGLHKLTLKDFRDNEHHIEFLVKSIKPKILDRLIQPLIHQEFEKHLQDYVDTQTKKENKKPINTAELYAIKERVLDQAFKQLSEKKQRQLINKDISLLKYASQKMQDAFLEQNPTKYSEYVKKHDLNNLTGIENEFQKVITDLAAEKKTKGNSFWLRNSVQKEVLINKKLNALYTCLLHNDKDNAIKEFEQLCLTCCQKRMQPVEGGYSINTQSAKWLINTINTLDHLKLTLGIHSPGEAKAKVQEVISKKHAEIALNSTHFKDRYAQMQNLKNQGGKSPSP
jgi:hypothetical protein